MKGHLFGEGKDVAAPRTTQEHNRRAAERNGVSCYKNASRANEVHFCFFFAFFVLLKNKKKKAMIFGIGSALISCLLSQFFSIFLVVGILILVSLYYSDVKIPILGKKSVNEYINALLEKEDPKSVQGSETELARLKAAIRESYF